MILTIKIVPVLNGFIVDVGCQKIVFTDLEKMCKRIMDYCVNPDGVEKEYMDGSINAKHFFPQEIQVPTPSQYAYFGAPTKESSL